jgi:hypothetical protein
MGESEPAWVKYANAIGILALLTGVIYFNPLGGSPSLPAIPSIPSIPSIFDSFRIQGGHPLDELPATLPNGCPAHKFKSVRHLSRAPDIMIIEGFLTPEEADVLVEVAYLTLSSRANLVIHYLKSQGSSAMLTQEILIKVIGIPGPRISPSRKILPNPSNTRSFDASRIVRPASRDIVQSSIWKPCK